MSDIFKFHITYFLSPYLLENEVIRSQIDYSNSLHVLVSIEYELVAVNDLKNPKDAWKRPAKKVEEKAS